MVERRILSRTLLVAMVLLQVLWLCASWFLRGGEASLGQNLSFLVFSFICGLGILMLPESSISIRREARERLLRNEKSLLLVLCAVVLFAGVVYARYNKVFLDEPENFNASRKVVEGGMRVFFAEYSSLPWLGKQHPPLVPLINGLAMSLFGVDLFVIRMVTLLFAMATLVVTYFMGKELYDRDTAFLAATLFIGCPFLLCLGAAALTDIQVTFFFTLGLLLVLRLEKRPTRLLAAALGLTIGLGILTKYTMLLIFPVLLGLLCTRSRFRRCGFHIVLAFFVAIVVVSPWLLYCWHSGIFALQNKTITQYSKAVIFSRGGRKLLGGYLLRGVPRGFGPYHAPFLFLGGLQLLRRKGEGEWFLLLWIVPVFLLLCLTLPDPRYFMPAFPALAVIAALGLRRFPESQGKVMALAWLFCGTLLIRFAVIGQGKLL